MSLGKQSCILPWETNKTIKATFKFLKDYQDSDEVVNTNTSLFLGIASLKMANLNNYEERNLVFNYIYGKIVDVLDNAVVIEATFECGVSIYTVAYSDIQSIQNDILLQYKDDYLEYMDKLPHLCKCEGNRYYDILKAIRWDIYKNEENESLDLVLIYAGAFSREYSLKYAKVVRNLILLSNGIVPITYVMGYFITTPLVENKEEGR